MTWHEHTPRVKRFAVRKISPRTVHFCVHGHALFLSPEDVGQLMTEFEGVLDGDGPQVVCEVVR